MELSRPTSLPLPARPTRGPQAILILGAALFSLGYIAWAVAGWGWHDWRGFFDGVPRDVVSAGIVLLFVGTFSLGCNVSAGRRDEAANNWIFPVMLAVGLALGWVAPHNDHRNLHTVGGDPIAYLGAIFFLLGTILRLAAVRTLGPRHSVWVAVQSDHALVTTGLYRFVRHPSYVGALLAVFGWALAFRSGPGLLLATLIVPPILSRIRAEEQLLLAEFGDAYQTYQRRTWRLVPFVY
ncbi:MAG TPA: isoprenylcysteine carboxylmethyltransferase family protein [Tepidisphaeraceae bacterium]|jgi:protein-S-isoprenylcysteine O-methyltransferase Ste14